MMWVSLNDVIACSIWLTLINIISIAQHNVVLKFSGIQLILWHAFSENWHYQQRTIKFSIGGNNYPLFRNNTYEYLWSIGHIHVHLLDIWVHSFPLKMFIKFIFLLSLKNGKFSYSNILKLKYVINLKIAGIFLP